METITNLIKDTPIPKMVKVRQNFDKTCIPESDIPGIITRELDRPEIGGKIQPGQKIAITCGSRGINHNALMARAIVNFVKSKGAEPYIVAAMGSHGGATAEGQLEVLASYGITPEAMGCEIRSSMEVVELGTSDTGLPVYLDKNAYEADGIIVSCRLKPHNAFRGPYESGPCKMLAVGLGKQKGAERVHSDGMGKIGANIPSIAKVILARAPILFALPCIENAYDETCRIEAIDSIAASVGDAQLVRDAKYGETPCTAEQLALKAMQKQAALGAKHLKDAKADNDESGAAGVGAAPNGGEEGSESDDKAKVDAIVGLYNSTKSQNGGKK